MLIGIDGNEANLENRVGINQYAHEILWGLYLLLPEMKGKHKFVVYLKSHPLAHMPRQNANWRYEIIPAKKLWIITKLMPHLYRTDKRPDVLFCPSHYVPPFSPMPKVCTITDLGYLNSKDQFRAYDYWQLNLWTLASLVVSKKVMAISEATKNDIVKHYPFVKSKIVVALLAGDTKVTSAKIDNKKVSLVSKKYKTGSKYILFLSTLKPSKNIEGLLRAWAKVENKHPGYKLVIAGKKGWLYDSIFALAKKLKLEKRTVFTGFVDESDKPELMAGAKLFILPSFWEGFGIDIVNAMSLGVPVAASARASIPEVAGSAGILFNPEKVTEIAKSIDIVLSMSQKQYNELVKSSLAQAKRFSWSKTAKETLAVLESVCE